MGAPSKELPRFKAHQNSLGFAPSHPPKKENRRKINERRNKIVLRIEKEGVSWSIVCNRSLDKKGMGK